MFVKIIKEFRDTTRNGKTIPTQGIYEVSGTRAKELIDAGVAEEYKFSTPEQKTKTVKKTDKAKNE